MVFLRFIMSFIHLNKHCVKSFNAFMIWVRCNGIAYKHYLGSLSPNTYPAHVQLEAVIIIKIFRLQDFIQKIFRK